MLETTDILEAEGQKILEGFKDVELDPALVDQLYKNNQLVLTRAQRAVVIETIRRHRAERVRKKEGKASSGPRAKKTSVTDEGLKAALGDLKFDL